jgi:ABC-type Fe3+/spermidine/putrescine transport system ATPase subunit
LVTIGQEALRPRSRRAATAEGRGHRAVVAETIYVGGLRRYLILLDGGERLVVVEPNVGERGFAKGEKLEVTWRPDDTQVIPAEGVTR